MARKVRAFLVWLLLPYAFLVLLYFVTKWPAVSAATIMRSFQSTMGLLTIVSCLAQAVLGTNILWLMPISRTWMGILVGIVTSAGVIAVSTWLELKFFGGFEANIGIAVTAMTLVIPSFLAAAYAAVLRTGEE